MLQQVENGLVITDEVRSEYQIACVREMSEGKRWHCTRVEGTGTDNTEAPPIILYKKFDGVTITPVCYFWYEVKSSLEIYRFYNVSSPDEPARFMWQGLNAISRSFFTSLQCPEGVTAEQERIWKGLLIAQADSARASQEATEPTTVARITKEDFQAQWSAQHPHIPTEDSADLTKAQKAMVNTIFDNLLPRNISKKLFPLWGNLLRAAIIGNITEVVPDETSDAEHDLSLDAQDLRRILWPSNIDKLKASFSENEALPTIGRVLNYYIWLLSREVAYYKNNLDEEVITPPHPLDKVIANTPVGQWQKPMPYGLTQEEQAYFAWLYRIYTSRNIRGGAHSIPVEKLARVVTLINHSLRNALEDNEQDIRESNIMRDFMTCVMLESEHNTEDEALRQIQRTLQEKSQQLTALITPRQERLRTIQEAVT